MPNLDPAFSQLADLDKDLQAELRAQATRAKSRQQTPADRNKHQADARRSKATFDLPAPLIKALTEIAADQGVSKSDLVTEFLIRAVNAHRGGRLDLRDQMKPARSLRWAWKLEHTALEER